MPFPPPHPAPSVGLCWELSLLISLMFGKKKIVSPMPEKYTVNYRCNSATTAFFFLFVCFYSYLKMTNKSLWLGITLSWYRSWHHPSFVFEGRWRQNILKVHTIHLEPKQGCSNQQSFFCLNLKIGMWTYWSSFSNNYHAPTGDISMWFFPCSFTFNVVFSLTIGCLQSIQLHPATHAFFSPSSFFLLVPVHHQFSLSFVTSDYAVSKYYPQI